jgi:hypothetical protein
MLVVITAVEGAPLKNRVLLETYYLPSDLETRIGAFVECYNQRRNVVGGLDCQERREAGTPP